MPTVALLASSFLSFLAEKPLSVAQGVSPSFSPPPSSSSSLPSRPTRPSTTSTTTLPSRPSFPVFTLSPPPFPPPDVSRVPGRPLVLCRKKEAKVAFDLDWADHTRSR
ncbi:hypothetical protein BDY24DRAFT_262464 [Mrakia frigida]|uniref:uncharacterized protein n=1 Tax=Mrakia frigida TaxID=29902 RepID=UPI003FCC153E